MYPSHPETHGPSEPRGPIDDFGLHFPLVSLSLSLLPPPHTSTEMLSIIWIALITLVAAAPVIQLSPREHELERALFKRQSITQRNGTDVQILNFACAIYRVR